MHEQKSTLYISTIDLTGEDPKKFKGTQPRSTTSSLLHILWHTLNKKYNYICIRSRTFKDLVCRETNKPLPKKLRKSLRLNKSAKNKGYEFFLSDEDARRLEEYNYRHNELANRIGLPYEYRAAYL